MIVALGIVYGVIAIVVIVELVRESFVEGEKQHIPQPSTGILNLLAGILWPLTLLLAAASLIFDSGKPKPIQDPPKPEPKFTQPPKGSVS